MKHEICEELRSHLEMHTADNIRSGVFIEEAARQARITLGGAESTKERYRERLARDRGIACANVAGLFLLRGFHRRGELAVRASLGATSGRIVRALVAEGVVLAMAGVVVGPAVAPFGTRVLADMPLVQSLQHAGRSRMAGARLPREVRVVCQIAAFLWAVAFIACAIPALRAARVSPPALLRGD